MARNLQLAKAKWPKQMSSERRRNRQRLTHTHTHMSHDENEDSQSRWQRCVRLWQLFTFHFALFHRPLQSLSMCVCVCVCSSSTCILACWPIKSLSPAESQRFYVLGHGPNCKLAVGGKTQAHAATHLAAHCAYAACCVVVVVVVANNKLQTIAINARDDD